MRELNGLKHCSELARPPVISLMLPRCHVHVHTSSPNLWHVSEAQSLQAHSEALGSQINDMKVIYQSTPAAELKDPFDRYQKIAEQIEDDMKEASRRKPKAAKQTASKKPKTAKIEK